ncbi:MAG: hypothetical protein Kow0062_04610 [Acidobacteriota bacterium]
MNGRKFLALLTIPACAVSLARANKVTELDLHPPQPLEIRVESTDGVVYDRVVSTGSLVFRLDADCRFDKRAPFEEHGMNELSFSAPGLATDLESPFMQDSKYGYWVTTPVDNRAIVLETSYVGNAAGKLADPVQACNDELARRVFGKPGSSREEFLARGFSVTVPEGGRLKVQLTCHPLSKKAGFTDFHDQTERFDLRITCLPSAAAKAKLTGPDAVRITSFAPQKKNGTLTCPGKISFKATIESKAKLSGKAWLEFLSAGPGSPGPGKGRTVNWSMNGPGQATSTLEQPWDAPAGRTVKGRTRLVVSWKGDDGRTYTAASRPVTFERRCTPSAPGKGLVLAPQIDGNTVRIESVRVDKPKASMTCPGKVVFRATISSKEKLSGETWLEYLPANGIGRPTGTSGKRKWSMKGPGRATSKLEQSWNGPEGKWVTGRTVLVVAWKDARGRSYTARSKPVSFERRCQKPVRATIKF